MSQSRPCEERLRSICAPDANLGITSILFDAEHAAAGPRLLRSLSWHLADRRPLHLDLEISVEDLGRDDFATVGALACYVAGHLLAEA